METVISLHSQVKYLALPSILHTVFLSDAADQPLLTRLIGLRCPPPAKHHELWFQSLSEQHRLSLLFLGVTWRVLINTLIYGLQPSIDWVFQDAKSMLTVLRNLK